MPVSPLALSFHPFSLFSSLSLINMFLLLFSFRALWHCEDMIQRYSRALNNSSLSLSGAALPHCSFSNVGKAVEDCMRAIIGVLLNLTHDNGTLIYNSTLLYFLHWLLFSFIFVALIWHLCIQYYGLLFVWCTVKHSSLQYCDVLCLYWNIFFLSDLAGVYFSRFQVLSREMCRLVSA